MQSDEALMAAYQRGEVGAFAELVARHERPLWNFVRRFVKDRARAEDLLQETFARVVKHAAEWRSTAKFSTWLYTIARNLCIDHARAELHRRALSLDAPTREGTATLHEVFGAEELGGERRAASLELREAIEAAIRSLPEPQREVFLLREVAELSFAEIAHAVGVSEPTVKSRMRYALERLREALALHREPHDPAEVTA